MDKNERNPISFTLKEKGGGKKKNHRCLYWLYTNDLHVLYNLMEDIRGRERSIVGGGRKKNIT